MSASPSRILGMSLAAATAAVAALGLALPLLAERFPRLDPERAALEEARLPPGSGAHLLGTDDQGRDCMMRLLAGASRTIGAAAAAVALAALLGIPAGLAAGYAQGWCDRILSRLAEIAMAFPALVLAIAIVAALGGGLANIAVAAGIVGAPSFFRIARAGSLVESRKEHVEASRILGSGAWRILLRGILPNLSGSLTTLACLSMGGAILEIAGLGFLGLGVEPGVPEWGTEVSVNRNQLLTEPWTILVPGGAIAAAVLGFNLLGESRARGA